MHKCFLPELKIVKLSDTNCVAQERCVKAVKASYSTVVNALNNIDEQMHEPEAHISSSALCNPSNM